MNPTIFGVRVSMLFRFYGWRLRRYTAQELLAGSGIAVGVALVFGVLVANTSLTGSAANLLHGLTGSASLQLSARSSQGFSEQLAGEVRALPGVDAAAGLLREEVTVRGPSGRESVQLIGFEPNIIRLGVLTQREPSTSELLLIGGLGLPAEVAHAIGVGQGGPATLYANGEAHPAAVRLVLTGALASATKDGTVAVALLPRAQELTGKLERLTQVLVRPAPGSERLVAGELRRLAGGRMNVESTDAELSKLSTAAKPTDQSTSLFAAIGAMVGFLLALNAMLLTVPERRRFIADLRMQGFDSHQVLLILGFQALVLGVGASLAGIALGDLLSHTLFHRVPLYLAVAFPLSGAQIVSSTTLLLALGAGVVATLIASLPPLLDLRPGRPADAVFREARGEPGITRGAIVGFGAGGLVLLAAVTVLVLAAPRLTIVGGMALALVAVFLIPAIFEVTLRGLGRIGERIPGSMLVVAVTELRSTATRSVALAGVAALAVYGSVAIGGARADLLHGIDGAITQYFDTADIWVVNGGEIFNTNSFGAEHTAAMIARVPGVASVRTYQGGLLDLGTRRLWVRARPASDPAVLEAGQVVSGSLTRASALIRHGGWIAISSSVADERHLRVGDTLALPTPSGSVSFGVAAVMTNSGWPPGAITMNAEDYRRHWQTTEAAALEIGLARDASATRVKHGIEGALAGRRGLWVRTGGERAAESEASARQGLRTLSEISMLLLIAAALSVASALTAVIWQRRAKLASLRIQGFDYLQLWRALLLESLVLLTIGSVDGVLLGVYGHSLASRWLELTTGFPAPFAPGGLQVLETFLLVAGMAMAVIALPGLRAARVPAHAGLQE
ncbi:MAG TPA: FtsX-like permease family protein [Solirubrobacteraceae bacterium]|jgi:putative ABC transport system permease protein|nr:FtsX-like permease family protein [Solirubrobacteraceae bacterium]